MITASPIQHKEFDLQTQLQLDRLWQAWASHDKAGDYLNEDWCAYSDKLWAEYQEALDAAYRQLASADADKIVARCGNSIRRQIVATGFQILSQRLTAVVQAVQ